MSFGILMDELMSDDQIVKEVQTESPNKYGSWYFTSGILYGILQISTIN